MTRVTSILAVLTLIAWPGTGLAQRAAKTPKAQADPVAEKAQELFSHATEELRIGNAAQARDLLRRSLALHSRIPTRYNLGIALRRAGNTTESIDMFDGLLRETSLSPQHRSAVEEQLDGARAELAVLEVQVTGTDTAVIELNAQEVGSATPTEPLILHVDAGEHVIMARAGGTSRQTVVVGPGETKAVVLYVLSLAESQQRERKTRRRKRAAWISGGIAVAAAAVITAVMVSRRDTAEGPLVEGTVLVLREGN